MNSFKSGRDDELAMHPTVKPVRMIADAMLDCSKPQSIVLDPFMGSGSTLLAGEKGRPKGSKNATSLARAELNRKVVVTVNGRQKSMTVAEIASRRFGDKAMTGDTKAFSFLIAIGGAAKGSDEPLADRITTPEQDQVILADYFRRKGFTK